MMKLREFKQEDAPIIASWLRSEEELHRWSVPPGTPQPDMQVHWSWQQGVLELRLQVSEVGRGLGLESSVTTPGGV